MIFAKYEETIHYHLHNRWIGYQGTVYCTKTWGSFQVSWTTTGPPHCDPEGFRFYLLKWDSWPSRFLQRYALQIWWSFKMRTSVYWLFKNVGCLSQLLKISLVCIAVHTRSICQEWEADIENKYFVNKIQFIQIFLSAQGVFCEGVCWRQVRYLPLMSRSNPPCVYPSEEDYTSLPRVQPLPTLTQNGTRPCNALTHVHATFLPNPETRFNICRGSQNSTLVELKRLLLSVNHMYEVLSLTMYYCIGIPITFIWTEHLIYTRGHKNTHEGKIFHYKQPYFTIDGGRVGYHHFIKVSPLRSECSLPCLFKKLYSCP